MNDKKKDLTRIEDLGEYLHELHDESSFEATEETPEIPTEDESLSETDFTLSEDTNFSSEEPAFGSSEEETTFESPDFGSTDFSSSDDESPFELSSEEEVPEEAPLLQDEPTFMEPEEVISEEPIFEAQPEAPVYTPPAPLEQPYKAPENFEDLKKFAESSSFSGMSAEGNPSFSVLIKDVRFIEDVNDILSLMKELNLLSDSEEQMKARLMRGHLLVPRVSEYAAIFLAHKLRRFDIDIQVGLSDEIHPPKHQESSETGVVSKHSLYQNQTHHFHFDDPKLDINQIILAATPSLEGHQVIRYLGVASEHKMLDGHMVEDESSSDVPRFYQELAQKLKAHALKAHANAVIGLNYQLTPLPSEYGATGTKYRLSCTGNLVWVNKL